MKIKDRLAALAVLTICLAFSACSGGDTDAPSSPPVSAIEKSVELMTEVRERDGTLVRARDGYNKLFQQQLKVLLHGGTKPQRINICLANDLDRNSIIGATDQEIVGVPFATNERVDRFFDQDALYVEANFFPIGGGVIKQHIGHMRSGRVFLTLDTSSLPTSTGYYLDLVAAVPFNIVDIPLLLTIDYKNPACNNLGVDVVGDQTRVYKDHFFESPFMVFKANEKG